MARYQRKCDMWVRDPKGRSIAYMVGGYKLDHGIGVFRDDVRKDWHLVDMYTGMEFGTPTRTRREAEEYAAGIVGNVHTPKCEHWHEELGKMAEEVMRQAEEWKAEGHRRQAERAASAQGQDPEPVEVVETPPVESYADVDANEGPETVGPGHRPGTRPDRFCKAYGSAYELLYDHDGDATVAALERSLVLAGEAFMREHPRMLRKFCKWRGDAFASDREVAALGMVALAWMGAERQDSRAA